MSSLGSETAKKYIDGCTKCEAVGQSYMSQYNSAKCILLHTERGIICAGKKSGQLLEKKKKTLDRLGKVVSALRNSGGGHVLIHVEGQIPEDRCLEQFDEFITRSLSDLIDDGELYVDTYRRHWLSDIHEFQGHADYVLVSVKETNRIATVDFNTKVRNDIENVSVTSASLALCMIDRQNNTHTKKPKIKGLFENIQDLHESRNIEIKRFHISKLKNQVTKQISRSLSDFVDYIWHDLKLKDNLTSMSKVEGGGSYYVGISEDTLEIESYRTKLLNIDGFCMTFEESEFIRAIKAKLQSDTIALQKDTFRCVPDDLIEVRLYPLPGNERRVLEIAVRYYDVIIFNDKDGPRAYEVKDKAIHRMDKATWLGRFKAGNK
ncbi:uncharacterized protein LOC125377445 [Haliotis rufescens]|uniref:uncharacterized protein LOC125377445 n=1 Tax=Haliotis rufescens TaxID=6454 RepID=UPI00201F08A6|nr:uncharacterized protein LOC125377445 [Haliotis rufescens]XP_048246862.1 uncharacterized protein LOC125377445 [Haliotis rufescens]